MCAVGVLGLLHPRKRGMGVYVACRPLEGRRVWGIYVACGEISLLHGRSAGHEIRMICFYC